MSSPRHRVAGRGLVLYDFLYALGGAERVTLELARGLADADLCVGYRDRRLFPDPLPGIARCLDLGAAAQAPWWRALRGLRAFRRRTGFLRDYDWALYSGSYAPVAVHNHPQGANLCYCHTIPRFAYDLRQYYLESLPRWRRPALRTLIAYVRPRYREAMQRMDLILANSQNVRRRIETHLGLPAQVVYPPVDVDRFRWLSQGDYYLSTARLEPYKRVDRIVEAFRRLPEKRLIVTSGGSQLGELKRLARHARNIELTGWTDEETLGDLLGSAIATLYVARDEDFGMSPVESLAAGKPVIGVAEGGLRETLTDRLTGILLRPDPSAADIAEAIKWLTPERAAPMRESCEKHASRFSSSRFLASVRDLLSQTLAAERSGSARMAGPVASMWSGR